MTKQKLLYLEDDDVLAGLTQKGLEREGYLVHRYSAMQELPSSPTLASYSHALLDLKLGNETSISLVKKLVELQPAMVVVIVTGYASIATAVKAVKLGATNYLAKPASIAEILDALNGEESQETIDASLSAELKTPSLKRLEWEKIQHTLDANEGNISATARQLKMHRRTLQRKLDKRPVAE